MGACDVSVGARAHLLGPGHVWGLSNCAGTVGVP